MRSDAALRRRVRGRRVAVLLVALALVASDGRAQLQRGQLRSSDKGCTISATSVSFGTYDPLIPAPTDSQGSISYSCGTQIDTRTPIKTIQVELSRGSSGSYDRAMSGGPTPLHYNLYLDAARQTVWGDESSGTDVLRHASPQNHQTYTVPVYGRILAQQDISAGTYVDTVMATIQW